MVKYFLYTVLVLYSTTLWAGDGDTHEWTLDNGLRVLVREDHRAPVFVSQVWYKVGSSYEPLGHTGISHMLEHMMFKGTKKYPKNDFSTTISALGGTLNAFTSNDMTVYYEELAANNLSKALELEADRMANLQLNAQDLTSELQVVKEERRMRIEDSPEGRLYERLNAAAYVSTAYHHPVIGWMHDIEQYTIGDLQKWYQQWYAPNNATLVIVGDVEPKETLKKIKQYFGDLPQVDMPVIKTQVEVEPLGERRVIVKAPAQLPALYMGYNVPRIDGLATEAFEFEPYALSVLAGILSAGDSSRIPQNLVRSQQILAQGGAYYTAVARLEELFVVTGTPAQGHTIVEAENALLAQITRLQTELVDAQELDRVKTNVKASRIFDKDSLDAQAQELGLLVTLELDWKLADTFPDKIDAITPLQIQQVAKKYLIADRKTVAVLDPQPITAEMLDTTQGDFSHVR